jgi:RNA recognition motif-containing protein
VAVRLLIGGLTSTSDEEVREMFAAHGPVILVSVPTVRDTTKPRPFAFIDLDTSEAAKAAIRALDGRVVTVAGSESSVPDRGRSESANR